MKVLPTKWIEKQNDKNLGLLEVTAVDMNIDELPLAVRTYNVPFDEVTIGKEQQFSFLLEGLEDVKAYKDVNDYEKSKESSLASQSIIPCGLFPANDDTSKSFNQSPTAIVTGVVTQVVENPMDYGFAYNDTLFAMDCLGWNLNCVLYKQRCNIENLEVGNVVTGVFIVNGWPESAD